MFVGGRRVRGSVGRLVLLVWTGVCTAEDVAAGLPDVDGWYLMPGASLGGTWNDDDTADFHGGVEVSLASLDTDASWYGVYADLVHDSGHTRVSLGPELGWAFLGLDAGLLLADDGKLGWAVRPFMTAAIMSSYYRYGSYLDSPAMFHEAGLVLKIPLKLSP